MNPLFNCRSPSSWVIQSLRTSKNLSHPRLHLISTLPVPPLRPSPIWIPCSIEGHLLGHLSCPKLHFISTLHQTLSQMNPLFNWRSPLGSSRVFNSLKGPSSLLSIVIIRAPELDVNIYANERIIGVK
jgi:hypothetical protein